MDLVATCAKGTEALLAAELLGLGAKTPEERGGAVAFAGSLGLAYRTVLWSRIASRLLLPLATFPADTPEALYEGVHAIPWLDHLGPEDTIAFDVAASAHAAIENTRYAALKAKDALVDHVRERKGTRPNVDTRAPDVRIHLYLRDREATVSLDLSGEGLHRRGYGRVGAEAPLKENLAAAILHLMGYPSRTEQPLVDPMCGSATLLVEAACIARDIAPGLRRERHGFGRWRQHDESLYQRVYAEAKERARASTATPTLFGSDVSERVVDIARENAQRAGVAQYLKIELCPLSDRTAPAEAPGLFFVNPPYGERLGESGELGPLYERIGDVLKSRFAGYSAYVLTGNSALAKRVGLRASRRVPLFNGPIECRLLEYVISSASKGEKAPGWRKPSSEAAMFENRLRKNVRRLAPYLRDKGVHCYRLYDADVPEYNVAVDVYDGAVQVQEYERPRTVEASRSEARLRDVMMVVPEVLGVSPDDVVLKVRRKHAGTQYEKRNDAKKYREVREGPYRFLVNLEDYLDTGIFLDHRIVRQKIGDASSGRSVLNLFAYTCTASVYAAGGQAREVTSVDLSNTYLEWGQRNFELNGLRARSHRFVKADALRFLATERARYDLVFIAPPIYSRSKAMDGDFDVQRDHVSLLKSALGMLEPDGEVWFSAPYQQFQLDAAKLPDVEVSDLSKKTVPPDFARNPSVHRTFRLKRRGK